MHSKALKERTAYAAENLRGAMPDVSNADGAIEKFGEPAPGGDFADGGAGGDPRVGTVRGDAGTLDWSRDDAWQADRADAEGGSAGEGEPFRSGAPYLRFSPEGAGYRVENVPFLWDADFGAALKKPEVTLDKFVFPFSGKEWKTFSIGETGTIVPGPQEEERQPGRRGAWVGREGGLAMERYVELAEAGSEVINTIPAISVFFKPRMTGTRYWKELDDRAVVTWSLTEPVGGIQDWTWTPTVNRFQAVLHRDGTIEFSYDKVAARDALVGVFPLVQKGEETAIATLAVQAHEGLPANLDVRQIALSAVDGLFLKVRLEARERCCPGLIRGLRASAIPFAWTRSNERADAGEAGAMMWSGQYREPERGSTSRTVAGRSIGRWARGFDLR